jgi:ABC-type transport system involved in cytochrome c biogenesis permease component
MALSKVSLSDNDIKLLIRKKKGNKNVRLLVLLFSILVLFIIYASVGFDTSNETFKFFKIVIIIVISALILSTLMDANFDNDLKEKQKFVGNIKVKKKEFWHNIEDNIDHYIIIFDEW